MEYAQSEFITSPQNRKIHCRVLGSGRRNILFFHGYPGSSKQSDLFLPFLEKYDLRILTPDRPGYGKSDVNEVVNIQEDVRDAERILDFFGIETIELVSVSGGTPFAIKSAIGLGSRVKSFGIFCGLAPLGIHEFRSELRLLSILSLKAAPYLPGRIASQAIRRMGAQRLKKGSEGQSKVIDFFMPKSESDKLILRDQRMIASLNTALMEAFNHEGKGPKRDARLYFAEDAVPWNQLTVPVKIYHGREDQILPYTLAQKLAAHIPQAELTITEHDGHFSLPMHTMADYLGHT
jgi:pimeloyl-ACP methyl ester carboxylesterase